MITVRIAIPKEPDTLEIILVIADALLTRALGISDINAVWTGIMASPNPMERTLFQKMIKDTEKEIEEIKKMKVELQNRINQAKKRREALFAEAKEHEEHDNIEGYFNSLTLLQKRELLEKVYSKIVIDTISNARFGPKRLRLKEIVFNQYSNIYGLCKVLGVQDFKQFNEYLKSKGRKELNILLQHYGDVEEYVKDIEKQNVSGKFREYINELQKEIENDEDREFMDDFIDKNMNLNLEEFEEKFAEEYRKYREQKEKEFCGVLN